MNLFGKIFTLLIFFLSITFLVLAVMVGATHRNWKDLATTNAETARVMQTRLDSAKSASGDAAKKLNAEQVSRQQQLAQLYSELQIAQTAIENATKENAAIVRENARLAAEQKVAQNRLTAQDRELADLKTRNKQLIEDIATQRATVVAMTNEQYRLQSALDVVTESNAGLASQLAQRTRVMNAHGLRITDQTDGIPRKVEGLVTGQRDGFIAISLGTDDGVRDDHFIDIYRGKKYIGRAKITRAEHNQSAARLLPEYTRTIVREGDYVTTKF